ncbi:MAG: sigma-54-dependent Fis family transcriptional regulator [Telmatospirillum sp.]|nr:sigma-54-dependent Fis family transcriptional regulator [Telmatospirillum sp.]
MNRPTVLIIDDEENLRASLIYGLKAHGIDGEGAKDAFDGLSKLEHKVPDMAFVDLCLPDATGLELLITIKSRYPALPVAMISAHGDIRVAVEAVKVGAVDFIAKPFELEDIVALIRKTVDKDRPDRRAPQRKQAAPEEQNDLIGESPAMGSLREQIEIVARSSARILLLLGPSGTGKGLIAKVLHHCSQRSSGPFVVVNCASLPEHLLEAELFGAERGAYTGAHQKRVGLVELAEGGTLFLDEVGELPIALQAKLLRFLENRAFRPVGGAAERTADVRIVAATNRNLEDEVKAGHFRADLYYRLNVVPLVVPSLAERRPDILRLADYFADQQAEAEGCSPITFSAPAQELMTRHDWPGNIRELRNLIERLTILHPGQTILPAHLPPEIMCENRPAATSGIEEQMVATERDILMQALRRADGSKGKAADILGISRYALKRRMNRLNLD